MKWRDNDELFLNELHKGYAWQAFVASFFACSGLSVHLPSLTVRENVSEVEAWTRGDFDLRVNGMIVEVKSRGESFTSPADFPYDEPFVDTVSGYEAKGTKPVAYVFVSQITGCMVATATNNVARFTVVKRHDRIRDIDENFYVCPRSALRTMDKLVGYLRRKAKDTE
jgi:hypothetical protein